MITSKECHVCGSNNLEEIFHTPKLPLTGLYFKTPNLPPSSNFDQGLMYCNTCGHGQLRNVIDPSVLYDQTYTHRTSTSQIATSGNDFFHNNLSLVCRGRKFRFLLEVGCNDLYLLRKTRYLADRSVGIDPIWIGKDHTLDQNTRVLGRFVGDLARGDDLEERPDIVISAHTFEHVEKFTEELENLLTITADRCFFMIEMPNLDVLVNLRRFDQVFHQHLQYVSLASMRRLVDRLGCRYLGHVFNHAYWGGTLLFWFEKDSISHADRVQTTKLDRLHPETIRDNFSQFKTSLRLAVEQAQSLREPVYGYGGAQMLPILAYHMESDLSFMRAIIDDNPERSNSRLPGILPIIREAAVNELKDAAVMVTALDSSRGIIKRLLDLNPRRVLYPLHNF